MNLSQSIQYLRRNPLFYILSIITAGFAVWWFVTPPLAILAACFSVLLVALALVDIKHYILPNRLIMLLAALGLVFVIVETLLFNVPEVIPVVMIVTRMVIAAMAMAFMLGLGWLGKMVSKREALGMGDVKMVGAITLWVNLDGLLLTLLIASVLALPWALYSITRRLLKHQKVGTNVIPFGPYLAVGAWISFMFRSFIWVFLMMAGV